MFQRSDRFTNLAIIALLGLTTLAGCAKESESEYLQRVKERDQERSGAIRAEYQQVVGTFEGSSGGADLSLTLGVTSSSRDTSLVPSPALVGKLRLYPRILISGDGSPLQTEYPFYDGVYDSGSGTLSFTIEKDQKASNVSCAVHGDALDCAWISRDADASFHLQRSSKSPVAPAAVASLKSAVVGAVSISAASYVGDDGEHAIEAYFSTALFNDGNSDVPRRSILGKFTFTEKNPPASRATKPVRVQFKSTDGTYDVGTGSLVFTIDDDGQGTKVKVNCAILTTTSLRCQWFGRKDVSFALEAKRIER